MNDARKPPYPRSPHRCSRCGAWSPDPWAGKQPHHCQQDNTKEGGDDAEADPTQAHEGLA